MPSPQTISRIAIIGFGEVGGIFGRDFAAQGIEVSVFDILLASQPHRQQMLAKANSCGVKAEDSLRDSLRTADLVISAVTSPASKATLERTVRVLLRPRSWRPSQESG
jgi:prephenate dehydrogenase